MVVFLHCEDGRTAEAKDVCEQLAADASALELWVHAQARDIEYVTIIPHEHVAEHLVRTDYEGRAYFHLATQHRFAHRVVEEFLLEGQKLRNMLFTSSLDHAA